MVSPWPPNTIAVTSAGEQTTPGRAGLMRRLPPLGQWIVLLTLGGACCGYPLLLWVDPLAIFHGVFTLWDGPVGLAGEVSAAALGAVLTISLLLPGAWCLRICPLGATQDLLALPAKGVRNLFSATRACGWETAGQKTVPDTFLSRRSVLSTCVGAVFFGLGARWGIGASRSGGAKPLRPPGSADETRFCGLCIRCGNCIRACPAGIIEPDSESDGIAGFLSPVLRFRDDYCREDCRRCTEVCPSGAIGRIALEDKPTSRIGVAVVDASICVLADDKECDKCARICPYEAIKIVWSEEEYIALPQVDREKCPGCGACEVVCPGTNDWERQNSDEPIPLRKAIEVRALV